VVEPPKLMKKPRSFLQSLEAPNAARVKVIELPAAAYRASLAAPVAAAPAR